MDNLENEPSACEEMISRAKIIDNINLNNIEQDKTKFTTERSTRNLYPTKFEQFDYDLDRCKKEDFNNAQYNLRNAQNTFIKIYDFIEKYRIDELAKYRNLNNDQIEKLKDDLNSYIDNEIKANNSDRKEITLRKLKEVLDFEYTIPDDKKDMLNHYTEALKANSNKIKVYLLTPSFFQGGKHRTKSRKSSHRKKSRSRSRSKGRSKSKRKNKSKK